MFRAQMSSHCFRSHMGIAHDMTQSAGELIYTGEPPLPQHDTEELVGAVVDAFWRHGHA
jgi:hypothetical protein